MSENTQIDPRITKTREALMAAFSELIREKTFAKITVSEITERARVNRATFYDHFYSKEELVGYAVHTRFEAQLQNWLPEQPALTAENLARLALGVYEFLGGVMRECYTGGADLPPALPLLHTQVQPQLQAVLKSWLKDTVDEPAIQYARAEAISWAIFGSALNWASHRDAGPVEEQVTALVSALLTEPVRV